MFCQLSSIVVSDLCSAPHTAQQLLRRNSSTKPFLDSRAPSRYDSQLRLSLSNICCSPYIKQEVPINHSDDRSRHTWWAKCQARLQETEYKVGMVEPVSKPLCLLVLNTLLY